MGALAARRSVSVDTVERQYGEVPCTSILSAGLHSAGERTMGRPVRAHQGLGGLLRCVEWFEILLAAA